MSVNTSILSSSIGRRVRQWDALKKVLTVEGTAIAAGGSFGKLQSPMQEAQDIAGSFNIDTLRDSLTGQLRTTQDFRRDIARAMQRQAAAGAAIIAKDWPQAGTPVITARGIDAVLDAVDAEMRRGGNTVKSNTVSVTAPSPSANNAFGSGTVIFASIKHVVGSEDKIAFEANQAVASAAFSVTQNSFDGVDGRHTFTAHVTRGLRDSFDDAYLQRPRTFDFTATKESHEAATITNPTRTTDNLVGNGTLRGSAGSAVFGWTVNSGASRVRYSTTVLLGTSPNSSGTTFYLSGNATSACSVQQPIPFQNASGVKIFIGDATFVGITSRMSGRTSGAAEVRFVFGGGDSQVFTYSANSNTWTTSGGFIHAGRSVTSAYVRVSVNAAFDGKFYLGDVCMVPVVPNEDTGLVLVARRGHNQSRIGDRWSGGLISNTEGGKVQTFLARTLGRSLVHSGTPDITEPA